MWSLNDMARFSTAQRKTAHSEMTQYRDVLTGSRGKSRRSRRRFLFKQTQSQLSFGSQSDEENSVTLDWQSQWRLSLSVSVVSQRHGQSQRQRDTHSHRHSHSHRDTVTAGCLLLYRNLPVSIPNSNYVYAHRYFFAFWPPCCIRFQLVWPYLTEKCSALDITIARFHCTTRTE